MGVEAEHIAQRPINRATTGPNELRPYEPKGVIPNKIEVLFTHYVLHITHQIFRRGNPMLQLWEESPSPFLLTLVR